MLQSVVGTLVQYIPALHQNNIPIILPILIFMFLGNEGSPFSSGYQKDTKNPFSSQSTNVHSIGRGVHYDNGSENQFSSIGRGIHSETPQEVTNGHGHGSFNHVPGQATNNGFEEAGWDAPHANTNGLQEPSNTFAKQSDHGNAGPGMHVFYVEC